MPQRKETMIYRAKNRQSCEVFEYMLGNGIPAFDRIEIPR